MAWRRRFGLLCMFLLVGTTYARKELLQDENENSRKTVESLRMPGDVKVSSSISHILRSLSNSRPSESEKPVHIITKTGVIETNRNGRGGKKLYYGEDLPSPVPANVPAPVVVSSQTISINSAQNNKNNNTKRGRSISTVDADGVRTIEGVRVPDDEHDKFHTWRNARVIKNFLVENNRPANPHRKRQIVLSDARQLLSGQSGMYAQSLGPTQATLIDMSSLAQPKYQQAQAANVYYTQTAIPQTQTQVIQSLTSQQDLTSALYAAAAAQQQQQQQQQQVSAQQVYQYQTLANSPAASTIALASQSGNGQEATYTYAAQAQAQPQPQQGQMYVLQPDGKTYLPYNPSTGQLVHSADQTRTHSVSHVQQPQLSQSQFQSRSSEQVDKNSAESPHPQLQQHVLRLQQEQQAKMQQEQAAYRQHILSKHRSHYQTEADQSGSAEKESSPSVSIHHSGQAGHSTVTHQQHQSYLNPTQLTHKSSREDLQQFAQIAATALPTGANIRQQLQEQVSAQTQQILQPHKTLQQSHQHAQVYQIAQQQHQAHMQVQERPAVSVHPVSQTQQQQYIIQPQTYSAGGGQMFSVPVPIPINQISNHGHHAQHIQANHGHILQHHANNREREREQSKDKDDETAKRDKNTLTNKLMESLHFNVNRRTAERFETSAVVPVLSSAGIILGLGALAAGWYLSKNNREVGIVKKSGKSEKNGSNGGKDSAVRAYLRRKRGTEEIDQASFFQNIIQHGIEKQQQTYEPAEHRYESSQSLVPMQQQQQLKPQPVFPGFLPQTNMVAQDRVQIKPLSLTRQGSGPGSVGSKGSKADHIVDKSGNGGSLSRVKNFANVAIPAVVLGGSVLVIAALIVGWYVSGANREIAFLEPSAYSRRKRSISSTSSTSLSDGWLHRILSSIHTNPYETEAAPSTSTNKDVIVPYPFDPDTSKSTISDSDITNLTVALSLSAFAFGALTVLGLAWYFTDNSRQVAWADKGPYSFGHWPTAYYGPRVRRSISTNDMTFDSMPENQGFLHKILDNLQVSQSSLLNKLHETGYSKWQETPCAQRIFCDVMATQSDDTVRLMEKRMLNFLSMLPDSVSSSLSRTLGNVMNSINKRDCSAFTCGGHWVDSTAISQPASQQPR